MYQPKRHFQLRKSQDNKSAKQDLWMITGTWALVILGIITAIFTSYYMGKQTDIMNSQVDMMREQNQSSIQLESQLIRPFAVMSLPDSSMKIGLEVSVAKDSVFLLFDSLNITTKNTGRLPLNVARMQIGLISGDSWMLDFQRSDSLLCQWLKDNDRKDTTTNSVVILPDSSLKTIRYNQKMEMSKQVFDNYDKTGRELIIYMYGYCRYKDHLKNQYDALVLMGMNFGLVTKFNNSKNSSDTASIKSFVERRSWGILYADSLNFRIKSKE